MPRPAHPRVVALRALGLGDLCTAVPALRALRRGHPQHEIVLAAPAWLGPLAAEAGVRTVDVSGLERPLPVELCDPEVAVNLHGRGPESIRRLLELRPRHLVTFRHPGVDATGDGPPWRTGEHEVERWCRLLVHHGIDADPGDLHLETPRAEPRVPGAVVVHPGAAAAGRRWPVERFAAVVRHLVAHGERVVITGSPAERALGRAIVGRVGCAGGRVIDLSGATDLAQLCALVAHARALISNDTGVAHLASAYRTPSVVLFGPTSPSTWGPPASGRHRVVWRGRVGDPHAAELDPGLDAITVGEVVDAIDAVLAG